MTFTKLGWRRQALFVEALALVSLAWTATHVLPFRWVRPLCGNPRAAEPGEGTSAPLSRPDVPVDPVLRDAAWALHMVHTRLGWDRSCLARAIAGRIMLRRRGYAPTLYIGAIKGPGPNAELHAWLLERDVPVTGVGEAHGFTTLAVFDGV